jgi:single-stranded-DNA-specific exonuclease
MDSSKNASSTNAHKIKYPIDCTFAGVSWMRFRSRALAQFLMDSSCLHDPFLMRGMDAAVEWVLSARQPGVSLCIFGDYDMDGMTATALLKRGFAEMGIDAAWRLPCRFASGYGLSQIIVDELLAQGVTHLVTVDTGNTSNGEIAYAKVTGMRVDGWLDHHQPSGEGFSAL